MSKTKIDVTNEIKEGNRHLGNVDLGKLNVITQAQYNADMEMVTVAMAVTTVSSNDDQYSNNVQVSANFIATPNDLREELEENKDNLVNMLIGNYSKEPKEVVQKFYIPKPIADDLFETANTGIKAGQPKQTDIGYAITTVIAGINDYAEQLQEVKKELEELKNPKEEVGKTDGPSKITEEI